MSSRKYIADELRELSSTLPSHVNTPVFSVPEGYFENFAASVLRRLKEETAVSAADELASLSPLLAGLSKKMPYDVPQNYFPSLSEEVPALIQEDELPAFLAEHSKKTPYEVPTGYFDTLPAQLTAKVAPKQAKVVAFNRTRWMRTLAAAAITGVIAISGWFYYNSHSPAGQGQVSDSWIASHLKNVSNKALEDFIETTDNTTPKEQVATNKSVVVRQMLKDVSVKEMDAFLSQVPTDDEDLSIIN
jgi:hypothetical protein